MWDGHGKIGSWQRSVPSMKCAHLLSAKNFKSTLLPSSSLQPRLHRYPLACCVFIFLGRWLLVMIVLEVFYTGPPFSLSVPHVSLMVDSLNLHRGRMLVAAFTLCTTWEEVLQLLCTQHLLVTPPGKDALFRNEVFLGMSLDNKVFLGIGNLDVRGFAG